MEYLFFIGVLTLVTAVISENQDKKKTEDFDKALDSLSEIVGEINAIEKILDQHLIKIGYSPAYAKLAANELSEGWGNSDEIPLWRSSYRQPAVLERETAPKLLTKDMRRRAQMVEQSLEDALYSLGFQPTYIPIAVEDLVEDYVEGREIPIFELDLSVVRLHELMEAVSGHRRAIRKRGASLPRHKLDALTWDIVATLDDVDEYLTGARNQRDSDLDTRSVEDLIYRGVSYSPVLSDGRSTITLDVGPSSLRTIDVRGSSEVKDRWAQAKERRGIYDEDEM